MIGLFATIKHLKIFFKHFLKLQGPNSAGLNATFFKCPNQFSNKRRLMLSFERPFYDNQTWASISSGNHFSEKTCDSPITRAGISRKYIHLITRIWSTFGNI